MFSEHLNTAVISIAKLNYLLTSTNSNFKNNSITVGAKQELQLTLSLKSLNNQNTRYALDYITNSPDVKVYYKARKEQNVEGEIGDLNSVIDINLVIENTGNTAQTVNFDLKGGYLQNELESNIVDQWVSTIMTVLFSTKEKLWAHKDNVQKIVFEEALIPKESAEYTYDISSDQDGSVMSYLVPSSDDNTKYIAYIQSVNKVKANRDSSHLFKDFTNLESIENLSLLDTSNVTDMAFMFNDCSKLSTTITIVGTNCTYYSFMFNDAAKVAGAQIKVKYTPDASNLVDQMIATEYNSNVVKESQPKQEYAITLSGVDDVQLSSTQAYRLKNITLSSTVEGKVVTSFKMNGEFIQGNTFKMPGNDVTISDVVLEESFIVESEHNPYPNNLNNKEYLNKTFEGAQSLTGILEYQTEGTS